MSEQVKVAIIGAGPAGVASAIFLKRAGLDPVLLERGLPGGLLREANLVENYPGFPDGIPGAELASRMKVHLEKLNVRTIRTEAKRVDLTSRCFEIESADGGSLTSDALIIATGTSPKKMTIAGADELEGRRLLYGVSSLSSESVSGRRVLILGGGDAAFDYAIGLRDRGAFATIASRSTPRCLPLLMRRAQEREIDLMTGCDVLALTEREDSLVVRCEFGDRAKDFVCDFAIVAHGREPQLDTLSDDLRGMVDLTNPPVTKVPGLFMAGDVVRGMNRQVAVAAGDGVLSAMLVLQHLSEGGAK